jgi:ferredoxin-like protein FixX
MSMFVKLEVDAKTAGDAALAKKLVEVCPVNIFALDSKGQARIVDENLDECTLCDLCLQAVLAGACA